MQTLASAEVKNKFGSVARTVKQGEPVTVTQYGESTMMILPYQLAKEALRVYITFVLDRPQFDTWQAIEQRQEWLKRYASSVTEVIPSVSITDCRDPKR